MEQTPPKSGFIYMTMALIALLVILLSIALWLLASYQERQEGFSRFNIELLNKQFAMVLDKYSSIINLIYETEIKTDPVQSYFYKGIKASTTNQENLYRDSLWNQLKNLYNHLNPHTIEYLHFHKANNETFLRFEKPFQFDDISNKTHTPIHTSTPLPNVINGFLEYKGFHLFQYVFPMQYGHEHTGFVEISISLKTIITELRQHLYEEFQLLILTQDNGSPSSSRKYESFKPWAINPRFMVDINYGEPDFLHHEISSGDRSRIIESLYKSIQNHEAFTLIIKRNHRHNLLTFIPIFGFRHEVVSFLLSSQDIDEIYAQDRAFIVVCLILAFLCLLFLFISIQHYRLHRKMTTLSSMDFLTQTYNRTHLLNAITREWERFQHHQHGFLIVLIGVDHFKTINEHHGHLKSDTTLGIIAKIIVQNIRKQDVLGRYDGDQFLLLLPDTDLDTGFQVAETIREQIAAYIFPFMHQITVSCGIAEITPECRKVSDLISLAEQHLQQAKANGRNNIQTMEEF